MRIVDVRERTVPLLADPPPTGAGEVTASAVAVLTDVVRDGRPLVGFGFDGVGRFAHGSLLMERLRPRLLAADPASLMAAEGTNLDPAAVWAVVMRGEKGGAHGERAGAVGLLDTAIWDLVAKIEDKPLWRVLAERSGRAPECARVFTYASLGNYAPDAGPREIGEAVQRAVDAGYTHVKIKAGSVPLADDLRRIEAALALVPTRGRVAVDANAGFDAPAAEAFLDAVAPYGLAWVEEPIDPLDFDLQARLVERYDGAMATGESLHSLADATNLVRYAGLRPEVDILQFDIALSYGLVEYFRILDMLEDHGWSRSRCLPHAGHMMALHAAGGLGLRGHESGLPGPTLFSGLPEGCRVEDGFINLPEVPGLGFELKPRLHAIARELAG